MITDELIQRINCLARKKRECGLTAAEEQEQAEVRRQYIDGIKDQLRPTLEAIRAGKDVEIPEIPEIPHEDGCGCGHCKH